MESIDSIIDISGRYDAIVLDQWGVLHDGSAPYPHAQAALTGLAKTGVKLGVLSNSGKRAAPNRARISGMGFATSIFSSVMTSGEALWISFAAQNIEINTLFPIEGRAGDAVSWAQGLDLTMTKDPSDAQAVLLMGLPDGSGADTYKAALQSALARGLPLYCSNPDLTSPRGGGTFVISPGALAQRYADMGGTVHLYGKPHLPIFQAMQTALDCAPDKILMVGDSLHHDILGAQTAGWDSLLTTCGVHAPDLAANPDIAALAAAQGVQPPTYALPDLR